MAKAAIKENWGIRIGVNQVITYATLVPIFWFIGQPILVQALADDIKQTVQTEIVPLNNAFVALLQRDINSIRVEIAAEEYRQRMDEDWDIEDAKDLANLKVELNALEQAKDALEAES